MAKTGFEASGRMSVEKFEQLFRAEFNVYCDIMDEKGKIAKKSASLASLRPKDFKAPGKVDFSIRANMQVANVQKKFRENFGLELQIYKLSKPDEKDTLASLRKGVLLGDELINDDRKEADYLNYDSDYFISLITSILENIIEDSKNRFKKENDFKVTPGYGYDKFYLTSVEGSYDMSLYGLIHYIMYEEGIYPQFLNSQEYSDLEKTIDTEPEGIYRPDYDENESVNDLLDNIYWYSIEFVAKKLISLGFNVEDTFEEYLK